MNNSQKRPKSKPPRQHPIQIIPNPRIVALLDYAIDHVVNILIVPHRDEARRYPSWFEWAKDWRAGQRQPAACVAVARKCFLHRTTDPIAHTLGQLAWAGKEACYSVPQSGWLTVRYIADAMVAFGVPFPDDQVLLETSIINDQQQGLL